MWHNVDRMMIAADMASKLVRIVRDFGIASAACLITCPLMPLALYALSAIRSRLVSRYSETLAMSSSWLGVDFSLYAAYEPGTRSLLVQCATGESASIVKM